MILRSLSYGVYVVSTLDGSRPTGCVANSIMQITSSPATIAVSLNHNNYTTSCIEKTKKFSVSILSIDSDPSLIGTFGFQSGKDIDKFADVSYELKSSIPVITDGCGYIVCNVINQFETSTHTIFIGEMMDGDITSKQEAMTYAYYHKVIKGKSPKNAPTYLPSEDNISMNPNTSSSSSQGNGTKSDVYVCGVCGYIYDGDVPFEELPDSFVCPLCKQPKSVFTKQS